LRANFFELAALLPRGCIDPEGRHALEMIGASHRINNMDRLVAAFETVFDERKRHAVFVLTTLEKRAAMTCFAEVRAGNGNGCPDAPHGVRLRGLRLCLLPILCGYASPGWPVRRSGDHCDHLERQVFEAEVAGFPDQIARTPHQRGPGFAEERDQQLAARILGAERHLARHG